MSKLKALVADTIKGMQAEIQAAAEKSIEVTAKAPNVELPKANIMLGNASLKAAGHKAEVIGELGYIAKAVRGGDLSTLDMVDLGDRFKAVGLTTDIAALLPSGFTGALLRDVQAKLVVTGLFPYKEVNPGQYDTFALHGITGYLANENTAGTESTETYATMIYLVAKCMATVKKSYEAVDQSLIPLADEVRMGIIDALARAVESAVMNGDNTATHMDAGVAATSYTKAFKGIRKLALAKGTVDGASVGANLTEAEWLKLISAAQEKGGLYLDDGQVSQGKVVLFVTQNIYNQLRMLPSFLTRDKAAGNATLFGAPVDTIFGMPVVMSSYIPASVNASGVIDATGANNTKTMAVMVNRDYFKYYTTGASLMETFRDIYAQNIGFVGSIHAGFNGVFDRLTSDTNAIDATRKTAIALINIAKI